MARLCCIYFLASKSALFLVSGTCWVAPNKNHSSHSTSNNLVILLKVQFVQVISDFFLQCQDSEKVGCAVTVAGHVCLVGGYGAKSTLHFIAFIIVLTVAVLVLRFMVYTQSPGS